MAVLTCTLPSALDSQLSELAARRGVPKSEIIREAIEAKVAAETSKTSGPANLLEALGEGVGSIASGKGDLASNEDHLKGYGR